MPLRKRKLPPSFFKEPSNIQENVFMNEFSTLQSNDCAFNHNEHDTENNSTLPQDTLESILDQTDFHDLLTVPWYEGNTSGNSSVFSVYDRNCGSYSPESYSDSSEGSYSVSPTVQQFRTCDRNFVSENCQPIQTVYENIFDNTPMSSDFVTSNQSTINQSSLSAQCAIETTRLPTNEAFLPLLNEPVDKFEYFLNDSVVDNASSIQTSSGMLPTFPQAFCGQNNIDASNNTSLLVSDFDGWDKASQMRPCYTYL